MTNIFCNTQVQAIRSQILEYYHDIPFHTQKSSVHVHFNASSKNNPMLIHHTQRLTAEHPRCELFTKWEFPKSGSKTGQGRRSRPPFFVFFLKRSLTSGSKIGWNCAQDAEGLGKEVSRGGSDLHWKSPLTQVIVSGYQYWVVAFKIGLTRWIELESFDGVIVWDVLRVGFWHTRLTL